MLLDELIRDENDYPHIVSALQHSHKILLNTSSSLLIFCPVSQVFICEYCGENLPAFVKLLKNYVIKRLQTTNRALYELLLPDFAVHYQCVQAVYLGTAAPSQTVFPLISAADLLFAAETYGLPAYIYQLYQRGRIFACYDVSEIVGYVAYHIDESVGALYVKPKFRNKGYGSRLMKGAFENYSAGIRYSQILCDNLGSIRLHESIGCRISEVALYWVYDEEFIYEE